jgi:hypothetical protein
MFLDIFAALLALGMAAAWVLTGRGIRTRSDGIARQGEDDAAKGVSLVRSQPVLGP